MQLTSEQLRIYDVGQVEVFDKEGEAIGELIIAIA